MISFPDTIRIPVTNHLTGRRYEIIRAADLASDSKTLTRITAICNEPEVYNWLFRDLLKGSAYPEEKARQWIEWSQDGWRSMSHFVFAVVTEAHDVAAACDIKSSEPVAEIGYWASEEHRGVMTNAVSAMSLLAREAGFTELYGRTKSGNFRSQGVLERAGFEPILGRTDDIDRFVLRLTEKRPNKSVQPTPGSTPRAIE